MNTNKRNLIYKTMSTRKRKYSNSDDDDDNDHVNLVDDDVENNEITDHEYENDEDSDNNIIDLVGRPKKKTKKASYRDVDLTKNQSFSLPGGKVRSLQSYEAKCLGSGIGEAPLHVVKSIRNYMDILLNSAFIEAKYITSAEMSQANSMLAIPGIVSAILEYNNISFKTIKYCITRTELFEPVWYTYNVSKNELILYLNESMYEEFCSKNSHDPIVFTGGIIPIEIFNPYESNDSIDTQIQAPIIHCAIAADHVAQHIIYDIYCKNKVACADIHEKFNEIGTTLHSMFYLERTYTKMPKREYANFLTLGGGSSATATQMPLMRSTQRLIDSILPPETHHPSASNAFAI